MSFLLDKKNQLRCGNPYLWGGLILLAILFSLFLTIPNTTKWFKMRQNIIELKKVQDGFQNEIETKKIKLAAVEKEFNKIAKDFLKEEKKLFPAKIDTEKIAKIFELYSIQYSLIDSSSLFEITSISFSKQSSENFTKTTVSLSIQSTKESLQDFIDFIQKNKLPAKLIVAQDNSAVLKNDISTTKFLRENILPIANIESVNSSRVEEENTIRGLLNTEIQINFFSQKEDDQK